MGPRPEYSSRNDTARSFPDRRNTSIIAGHERDAILEPDRLSRANCFAEAIRVHPANRLTDTHDRPMVFPNDCGGFLWRHSWRTRTFTPAFDVNLDLPHPPVRVHPIRPGLTFHELRHSHKTWLIAAGVPEIAQARRLGHRMDERIVEVYSHVAYEVEAHLQATLKQAWLDARHALADHPAPPQVTARDEWIRRRLGMPAEPRRDGQGLLRDIA